MIDRVKLRYCCELAFHPPRLNEVWRRLKAGDIADVDALGEMLDTALLLHQALPSEENVRRRLHRGPLEQTVIPGWMVRDIGLPPFCHHRPARPSK